MKRKKKPRADRPARRRDDLPAWMFVTNVPLQPQAGPDEARSAFALLCKGEFAYPAYEQDGEARRCWANVERRVSRQGGRMVCGWLAGRSGARDGRNRYRHVELVSHAVWEDQAGRLVELTEGGRGMAFLPDPLVRPGTGTNVLFLDDWDAARHWTIYEPCLCRVMLVPASASIPAVDRGVVQFGLGGGKVVAELGPYERWSRMPHRAVLTPAGCLFVPYQGEAVRHGD